MTRSGPLYTLLAGALLALFMLSLNATTGTRSSSYGGAAPPSAPPSPSQSAPGPGATKSPAPTKKPPPARKPPPSNAEYAGRTDDRSASVAITLRDGKAIAYFCDGRTKESWLKGDVADDGSMHLTGKRGARLDGRLDGTRNTEIRGTVDPGPATPKALPFSADKADKPALYRASAPVRGARLEGGWIVLPGGRQVGILKRDGKPARAPRLDPATGEVRTDGGVLTAKPVTP
ncbi:hypothetical protein ACQB60_18420 [Actinomycetota bacterium Odt1-20B]